MKKILLSAAAVFAAMSMNAQVFKVSAEANGITSEEPYTSIEEGKVWGEIEGAVTISNAFTTTHKALDNKNNDFTKVIIDGNEITTADGVQGQDNPKDEDGGNPALTLKPAVSGAVIKIEAKKNGWVYIAAKLSTNKQYMVFEEGSAMGYKIAMENTDARVKDGVLNLEIQGEGEYNYIPEGRQIQWVIREYLNDPEAETAGNGLGVFYFPVAEGCTYLAHATGSKIMWNAVYFSETEAQSVTVEGEGISKTLIGEGGGVTPAPVEEKVYSVIGTLVGGWDVENDVDMTVVNGVYSATIDNIAAGSYEWKIRQDHDWAINWGDAGDGTGVQDGPNFIAELPEGASITITFNPATAEIHTYVVGGAIEPEPVGPAIVAEIDWTTQEAFNNWCSGENGSTAVVGAEGLEINVPSAGENYWNPQTVVLNIEGEKVADNPDAPAILAEDGRYQVIIVAKHPAGHLQVNLGTWDDGVSLQKDFDVEEAADFHEIVVDFSEGWPADCFSNVHVLWQSGALPGLSVLKSIQIIDLDATAIKTVKAGKKFDGAIYNLAGQKVNASYKGVVIKDGKKYIQK